MKRLFILFLSLSMIVCIAGCASKTDAVEPASGTVPAETEVPAAGSDPAPENTADKNFPFSTTDINGNPIDQGAFKDYDLIMLNFWAYWCGPCVNEMPELEQLHQMYPNMLLLGISVDNSDMDLVNAAVEKTGVTYPVLYPKGGLAYLSDKCQYIPTTYFLNSNGEILGEPIVGSNDLDGWSKIVDTYLP